MKRTVYTAHSTAYALALGMTMMFLAGAGAVADRISLPQGTVIPVKLDDALNSRSSHKGDLVTGTVRNGKDDAHMPPGTRIEGVVREARSSVNGKPGYIDVDFRRIVFPGEDMHTINASLSSLSSKSVKSDSSGRLISTGDRNKDRLKWVGLGAGAGAVIGALTKGSTLQDLLIGGGLGYLFNEYVNKPTPGDVDLKQGAEFGVRLNRDYTFNTSYRSGSYSNPSSQDDNNQGQYYTDQSQSGGNYDPSRLNDNNSSDIGVMMDDRSLSFGSARPFNRRGVIYLPLRDIAREADIPFEYNSNNHMLQARNGRLRLNTTTRIYLLDGNRHSLPAAPVMQGGVLYVPMQFVSALTDKNVQWDASSRTVMIDKK